MHTYSSEAVLIRNKHSSGITPAVHCWVGIDLARQAPSEGEMKNSASIESGGIGERSHITPSRHQIALGSLYSS